MFSPQRDRGNRSEAGVRWFKVHFSSRTMNFEPPDPGSLLYPRHLSSLTLRVGGSQTILRLADQLWRAKRR